MIQFPTDNLYKFLAISGVILVSLSLFLPEKHYDELGKALVEFARDRAAREQAFALFDENSTRFRGELAENEEGLSSIQEELHAVEEQVADLESLQTTALLERRVRELQRTTEEHMAQIKDRAIKVDSLNNDMRKAYDESSLTSRNSRRLQRVRSLSSGRLSLPRLWDWPERCSVL